MNPGDLAPLGEACEVLLCLRGDMTPDEDEDDWGDDSTARAGVGVWLVLVRTLLCHPVSGM